MNRLQRELHRLYAPQAAAGTDKDCDLAAADLIDAQGRVRALVLELARPADWAALAKVWRGVQVDLDLPAPAIAVSGTDGYQLWFSLAEPVSTAQAMGFLEALRRFYLGDIQTHRVAMRPMLDAASPQHIRHAQWVPAAQPDTGMWSAFVAADLAALFMETPWLDLAPNPDGQAQLLAGLNSMHGADFQRAIDQLSPARRTADAQPAMDSTALLAGDAALAPTHPAPTHPAPAATWLEPKLFLQSVMIDDRVALALRIEAAKALLPYVSKPARE